MTGGLKLGVSIEEDGEEGMGRVIVSLALMRQINRGRLLPALPECVPAYLSLERMENGRMVEW